MPLQPESRLPTLPVTVMALSQAAAGDGPGGQELSLAVLTRDLGLHHPGL